MDYGTIAAGVWSAGVLYGFQDLIRGRQCVILPLQKPSDFLYLEVSVVAYPTGYTDCLGSGLETEIIDVKSATNKVWMDRNLGASRAATEVDDSLSYGALFQWGRFADGHQCRNSETTFTLSSTATPGNDSFIISTLIPSYDWLISGDDNLWQGVNGMNNPCPNGFRIPTNAEWEAERLSWSELTSSGAFDSPLRLTHAGKRSGPNFGGVNQYGRHWSSTTSNQAYRDFGYLGFAISGAGVNFTNGG